MLLKWNAEAPDDKYGTSNYETEIQIPEIEEHANSQIHVIFGPSGSGKTTILKHYSDKFRVNSEEVVLPSHGRPIDFISEDLLLAVSLMSIPAWFTDIENLSGGERERLKIAFILKASLNTQEWIILDEFSSLVDRATAKGLAKSVGKWIRENNKKIILATIHTDFFHFMKPDFIWSSRYNKQMNADDFPKGEIDLTFKKGSKKDWSTFKQFHYLSGELSPVSDIYLSLHQNFPIGFIAITAQFNIGKRIHRLVVLPEYQSLGVGSRLLEYVTQVNRDYGFEVYIKTSHPAMGHYLNKSDKWTPTVHNMKKYSSTFGKSKGRSDCWCFKSVLEPAMREKKFKEDFNTWKPLKLKGRIEKKGKTYALISKNKPTLRFVKKQDAEYVQYERSVEAGFNSYKILNSKVVVRNKNKEELENPYFYISLPRKHLQKLRGHTWHIRKMKDGFRARSSINRKQYYMEEYLEIPNISVVSKEPV